MKLTRPAIASAELLLLAPSALFMTALFVRNLQPPQYQPAHLAQQIVNWYAARTHLGLWGLLIALPVAVLATGGITLRRRWRNEAALRDTTRQTLVALQAHLATLIVAGTALVAAVVLAIVALHVLTD